MAEQLTGISFSLTEREERERDRKRDTNIFLWEQSSSLPASHC